MLDEVGVTKPNDCKLLFCDAKLGEQWHLDFAAVSKGHAFTLEFEREAFRGDYFCHELVRVKMLVY
ncbi:MAG: hypothetical protein ACR2RV_25435 [Verrucomicrobiales bacterium]